MRGGKRGCAGILTDAPGRTRDLNWPQRIMWVRCGIKKGLTNHAPGERRRDDVSDEMLPTLDYREPSTARPSTAPHRPFWIYAAAVPVWWTLMFLVWWIIRFTKALARSWG